MSDHDTMREILERKLRDPAWLSRASTAYEDIIRDRPRYEIPLFNASRIELKSSHSATPEALLQPIGLEFPEFEEPGTVEEIWMDRWQLSSGGYSLTRTLDDTVLLDYPDGRRYIYSVIEPTAERFTWCACQENMAGRQIKTVQCTTNYVEYEDALFEMHRQAMAEYIELTNLC